MVQSDKNKEYISSIPYEPLTEREQEILSLIARGSSNREIAETLFIAHSTVRWYIRQIYSKLGAENREQAIELALKIGIASEKQRHTPESITKLPTHMNDFIGREKELADLSNHIQQPDNRLITILAPGGMGKTRLALALADRISSSIRSTTIEPSNGISFPDGVWFVPLSPADTSESIISTLSERVGYRFQQDGRELKQQLLTYLRDKNMLVILDNVEHLLDRVNLITEILENAPNIKMIATSRERLRLSVETVYNIGGMSQQDFETMDEFLESDAVKLFVQSARRTKLDFVIRNENISYLSRIFTLVGGMPLGITLAAGWVDTLSIKEIADEIHRNIDFLSANVHDLPERQYSIRAIFQRSWQQLTEAEQEVTMKLSIFHAGCKREAAEIVAKANLPLLQSLINKSILWYDNNERYQMHSLLRQFAEEQLEITLIATETKDSHSVYYANLLFQLKPMLRSKDQQIALNTIEEDVQNIRVGWYHAIKHENLHLVEKYLKSLYYFFSMRSRVSEGIELFTSAIAKLTRIKSTKSTRVLLGKVLARQGSLAHRVGNYEQAKQLLETSLVVFREIDAKDEVAFVLNNLADVTRASGQYEIAKKFCEESLAIFQSLGDEWSIAGTLNNLGVTVYHLGELTEAEQHYERSLGISKRLQDLQGVATSLVNLGAVEHDLGKYEEANQFYQESLDISEQLNDRYGVAAALINLGRTSYMLGTYTEGKVYCEESLEICRKLGDLWGVAASLINLADLISRLGHTEAARSMFRDAMATAQRIQASPLIIETIVGMADLLSSEEKYEYAFKLLQSIPIETRLDTEVEARIEQIKSNLNKKLPEEIVISLQEENSEQSIKSVVEDFFEL